jgi:Do/DeqQ family serine protease
MRENKEMKTSNILIISLLVVLCLPVQGLSKPSALRRTPIVIAVEKASPAVVNISTEQIVRSRRSFGFSDPFFDQFFRDFLDPYPRRQYKQSSLGSGVIIDQRGYVLTNYHVIVRASKISITLADKRAFEAEIIGTDPKSDLTILKALTDENLPVAKMGTSADLMIGEPVIAIGNPFGLSHTITTGVISALNRTIRINDDQIFRGFIQTDAPINPGNSGGPLINILGDLIGINTAIYGNAEGIGFAIPIDKAKRIIDDLIEYGQVRDAWIGIQVQDITPAIAQYFEYPHSDGVLVAQVIKQSAAERAGLQQGDIIVEISGQTVQDQSSYHAIIAEYTADDTLTFSIIRNGKSRTLQVRAEEFSPERAAKIAHQDFGFYVEEITQQNASQYLLQTQQGVVITDVRNNSPASQVGIEPGDVIRQVDGLQIMNLQDFRDVMMKLGQKRTVVFLVQRNSRGYYVTLERQ